MHDETWFYVEATDPFCPSLSNLVVVGHYYCSGHYYALIIEVRTFSPTFSKLISVQQNWILTEEVLLPFSELFIFCQRCQWAFVHVRPCKHTKGFLLEPLFINHAFVSVWKSCFSILITLRKLIDGVVLLLTSYIAGAHLDWTATVPWLAPALWYHLVTTLLSIELMFHALNFL